MKSLRRWLFNGLTAISLLLFLTTSAIWIRSQFAYDQFYTMSFTPIGNSSFSSYSASYVIWDDGRIKFEVIKIPQFPTGSSGLFKNESWTHVSARFYHTYPHGAQHNGISSVRWFQFYRGSAATHHPGEYQFVARLWPIAAMFSLLPIYRLVQTLRHPSAFKRGLCLHCGYDLRATPDRCPECGTLSAKP